MLLLAFTFGCANSAADPAGGEGAASDKTATSGAPAAGDHSGWWCAEHGVPEEICGRCSASLAAEFQRKGDWCKEHDRPDSQCFICHPHLEATFAARYEAKMGAKPPTPEG
jgi:cobalt-zinc-cadmium efflux system membrane fusion protein